MRISELVARLEAVKAEHGDLECRWEHLRPVEVVEARPMGRSERTEGVPIVRTWNVLYLGAQRTRPAAPAPDGKSADLRFLVPRFGP